MLTDDSLVHLAALTNLRRLALDGGGSLWISDDNWKLSLRLRREALMLRPMKDRELAECRRGVGNAALKHIGRIRTLKALSLRLTSVADADLLAIANLVNLEELDLSYTAISGDGLEGAHQAEEAQTPGSRFHVPCRRGLIGREGLFTAY